MARTPGAAMAAQDIAKVVGSILKEGEGGIKQAVAEGKGWSLEDISAYADSISDNHPMFAESIEDMDPAYVEAIEQIKFADKDKFQLAEQAKSHGNMLFQYGKKNPHQYQNSIVSYNEAEAHAKEAEDTDELRVLLSQIYSNRAFAHLMMKNYRSCKEDCDKALKLTPENVKAWYRKAKACQALRQYEDAIATCDRGLEIDAENKEMMAIRKKCMEAVDEAKRQVQAREDAQRARVEGRRKRLREAWGLCAERGIKLGEAFYAGSQINPTQAQALPTRDPASGVVTWPVLLLYPQHGMSDFIEHFGEEDMLAEHLAAIFPEEGPPAPWDREHFHFRCTRLEVYFQARGGDAFGSVDEYVAGVERFAVLVGQGEEAGVSREAAEAALEKRNVWKDHGEYWVQVHVGCTLSQVLRHCDHVIPATLPSLHVYARDTKAHADFLAHHKGKIRTLNPTQA